MARRCKTFDHTADVGLTARADTLPELFQALAEGLADVICPRANVRPQAETIIAVEAEDVEALAVDFLWKVMDTIQVDHQMVATVEIREVDETHARGVLMCEDYDPARHEILTEIKAVTYHELKIAREGDGWTGRIILDL
jgi:SHS2 domain-containing protein